MLKELLQSEHIVNSGSANKKFNIADTLIDVLAYSTVKANTDDMKLSGMFSLKVFDDKTIIRMGKVIKAVTKDTIEAYTKKIKALSEADLEKELRQVANMSDDIPYKRIHVGLCKMYRKYKEHFTYTTGTLDNGDIVYAIEIII